MDVSEVALDPRWCAIAWIAAVAILAMVLARSRGKAELSGRAVQLAPALAFALCVLWALRAQLADAMAFHLLGSAAFALTAGVPAALVGGAVVVGVSTLVHDAPLQNAAFVWLASVAVPVAVASGVLRVAERRLPANFFVYLFAACFLGAALAFGAGGLASALVAVVAGGLPAERVFGDYAPYLIHLAFGEAMLTGGWMTLAVVYRPEWIATFDDARYLEGK